MYDIEKMLYEYPMIDRKIFLLNQNLNDIINSQKYAFKNLQSVRLSDIPKSVTNKTSDSTYETVEILLDNLNQIYTDIEDYVFYCRWKIGDLIQQKNMIDEALRQLTKEECQIIELRYWKYPPPKYTWERVADESNYCVQQCIRLRDSAISKITC